MSGRLDGIQILRFVAAALVLIQHAAFLPSIHYAMNVTTFLKLQFGASGVFIFFVISGYVVAGLIDQNPLRFALHRIVRIYPPYVAAMFLAVLIVHFTGLFNVAGARWLWSYTLMPLGGAVDSWTQVPFWTLIYEMTFYALTLALVVFGKRAFDIGLILWAVIIYAAVKFYPMPPAVTANILAIITNPFSLLFISGAALRRAHDGQTWVLAALALVMSTSFWQGGLYLTIPVFALGTLAIIHFAVIWNKQISEQRWIRFLVRGGDYSYGLYLIHSPIIAGMLSLGLAKHVTISTAIAVSLVVGGGLGLAFGWLDHFLYGRVTKPWADLTSSNISNQAYKPPVAAEPAESPGR